MEYFNTYGGNPVSAETGLAVLDVLRDERLQANAAEMGAVLLDGLRALRSRHPLIGHVRGEGLFIGVELSSDRDTRAPATEAARLVKEAVKARGVLISTDGPDDNVLKLKPPMVIGPDDCAFFLEALDAALGEASAAL
jgi:4-aminobutyrate aminotransferase-like enzyme